MTLGKTWIYRFPEAMDKKWVRQGSLSFVKVNTLGESTLLIQTGGVMVIVVGNGHRDTSSNPGQDWLHFA